MDNDFDSSLMLWRMLAGPATAFFTSFIMFTVTAPLVMYVVARWRAHREPVADPQLGLKFALHYFMLVALQVLLGGAALLIFTLLQETGSDRSTYIRAALGLMTPAAVVLVAQLVLLARTNDAVMTGVRRLFLGYNLLSTGLLGFVGLILGSEVLFSKDGADAAGHAAIGMIIVYCGAWAVLAWRFGSLVLGGPKAAAPPMMMTPPAVMPPLNRD
jgi:hypothetical protein